MSFYTSQSANPIISTNDYKKPTEVKNAVNTDSDTLTPETSIDSRIRSSLESSEAVFLYFYAEWCGFCKKEKPIIDVLEQTYSPRISFIRLNNEKDPQAFREFGVSGFPTMFLITGVTRSGEFVSQKFTGFTDEVRLKDSFSRW